MNDNGYRSDRIYRWKRLTDEIKSEWETIEGAGLAFVLDAALDQLIGQVDSIDNFRASQTEIGKIVPDAEKISAAVNQLCELVAITVGSVAHASDQAIVGRAGGMVRAAADLRLALDRFQLAASELSDTIPRQKGGRGVLSDQLSGGSRGRFQEFAETARAVWMKAGLRVGGNGVEDQGFGMFLDAVHMEVFGCKITGRAVLLSKLRDTWPKGRIR